LAVKTIETTTIFVGDEKSGKTTILNMLRAPSKEDTQRENSSSLDYCYLRRNINNKKEIANIYELEGGRNLISLLSIPMTKENFQACRYAIVLDLSKPHEAFDSLLF